MSDVTSTPRPLKPERELNSFFDQMFGVQTGFTYIATKHPTEKGDNGKLLWVQHFFKWPDQKAEMLETVVTKMGEWEVYFSPSLFTKAEAKKETFKGTYHLWTEFDGSLPTAEDMEGIPEPTIKLQSSDAGHEHWYWRLTYWEDNYETIEKLTKPLAYGLKADLSAWAANKVLRPPSTIHHESNKVTFFLKNSSETVSLDAFASLPEPTSRLIEVGSIKEVPNWQDVVYGYKWPAEAAKLFRRPAFDEGGTRDLGDGKKNKGRSSALTALGYYCAEMGMSDPEILSILFKADDKWGKFKQRPDQKARLISIINYIREKKPLTEASLDSFPVYGAKSFQALDIHLDWFVENLIEKFGLGVITSPPGVGKTQWVLQLMWYMSLGKKYLIWDTHVAKSMFVSMEMGAVALKEITTTMLEDYTEEDMEALEEYTQIVPLGQSINLAKEANQAIFYANLEQHKPEIVFLDSLGVAINDNISDDTVINNTFDFIKRSIINDLGITVMFLHHNRKEQAANRRPNRLADLYGSQYIGSNATNVVGLWQEKPGSFTPIDVNSLKMRVAESFDPFKIRRNTELDFDMIHKPLNRMGFETQDLEEFRGKDGKQRGGKDAKHGDNDGLDSTI